MKSAYKIGGMPKLFAVDIKSAFEEMYKRLTFRQPPEHIFVKK